MNELLGTVGLFAAVVSILLSTAVSIFAESQYTQNNNTDKSCRPNQLADVDIIITQDETTYMLVSDVRTSEFSSGEYRHGGWGYEASLVSNDGIDVVEHE